VRAIRLRETIGIFRVLYVANIGDRIFVLHCFQKKTQKTNQQDLKLAESRFKAIRGVL
jgi:phage-related protein